MSLASLDATPAAHAAHAAHAVKGRPVAELLLLVGDADRGYKSEAVELLLGQGLEANLAVFEAAVANDDEADLRNGAMEMLVKFGEESVPSLSAMLADPNEQLRNFSAVMLGDIASRKAVGPLIRALGDADPNVGHGAAEALGKIGDRAAVEPLLELLTGDLWLQFPAVTALGLLRDSRAVPHLLPLLEDPLLAVPAAEALGSIGDPRALSPLASLLAGASDALAGAAARALVAINRSMNDRLNFKNTLAEGRPEQLKSLVPPGGVEKLRSLVCGARQPEAVEAAVTLLGWLGDLAVLDDCFALLDDERYLPAVESAVVALGRAAEEPLLTALRGGSDRARIIALRTLRWLGVPCPNGELARLIVSSNESLQGEVLETLTQFPREELLPLILRLVERGSEEVSRKGCEALGRLPLDLVRDPFWGLARCEDPLLRRRSALLLGHLPGCGGLAPLEALAGDRDPGVRGAALQAIGLQRVPEGVALLKRALSDPDETVREAAVTAAADFCAPVLVEEIVALLGSGSQTLDYAVIRALGVMGAPGAGSALVAYLEDGEVPRQLAYALIEALGRICYAGASQPVSRSYLKHSDPDFRRLAVETLGKLGDPQSLRGVEEAVADPHWSVRIAALQVLGRIGGVNELPLLLGAMRDQDAMVRKHAIIALGELRDPTTVPVLVEQLADPELSRYAFEALLKYGRSGLSPLHRLMKKGGSVELRERIIDVIGKIGAARSVAPLLALLEDPSEAIRLAAIDALSFCYDSLPFKKLLQVGKSDRSAEVRDRAQLALKSFAAESYS
jgi:HEAT repeat protein